MLPGPMRDGVQFMTRWMRADNNLSVLTILFCFVLFQEVDQWSFDVFAFHKATGDHALKFLVYDLLTRYDLINRFRVHTDFLSLQQSLKSRIRLRGAFTPALISTVQLKEVVFGFFGQLSSTDVTPIGTNHSKPLTSLITCMGKANKSFVFSDRAIFMY